MHDLDTIARRNEAAVRKHIDSLRAAGHHVTVVRAGLTTVDFHPNASREAAEALACEITASEGRAIQCEVLSPMTAVERAVHNGRDQSEDYTGA